MEEGEGEVLLLLQLRFIREKVRLAGASLLEALPYGEEENNPNLKELLLLVLLAFSLKEPWLLLLLDFNLQEPWLLLLLLGFNLQALWLLLLPSLRLFRVCLVPAVPLLALAVSPPPLSRHVEEVQALEAMTQ